jgi:hypothetical protein
MKRLAAAVILIATIAPAAASYTECVAKQDTELFRSPGGNPEPRLGLLEKGNKAGFRDSAPGWWYIVRYDEADENGVQRDYYGWVPRSVLIKCKLQDGTP